MDPSGKKIIFIIFFSDPSLCIRPPYMKQLESITVLHQQYLLQTLQEKQQQQLQQQKQHP